MVKNVRRLYKSFQPERYDLELVPDKDKLVFRGSVTIVGKVIQRPAKRITFHQSDLKIESATITRLSKKSPQSIEVSRINTHKSFDEVRLHTNELLYPGDYQIKMHFSGKISRPMNGIYPCFFSKDGKQQMIIATQFESHHAREAFPCIDEPEAKAVFNLKLTSPKADVVISNTPVSSEKISGNQKVTIFEETPKMSTYLLAFVFGDLGHTQAKTKSGVVVRAYATPQNAKFTKFAVDVAAKTLDFYNSYFGIDYPLAKCDMVALPDFSSGAMENWGLVTYREQTMLVDPANTSLTLKQYVVKVVTHELAHQWFGNLVTMRWWTDIWLNEGFASWVENLAVDHLFPQWQIWTQFAVDETASAFSLDALDNTHPIEVPIKHPDDIRTVFDAISYNKGASLIHMLNNYLGADNFRAGLRHYLRQNAYSNADTADLWAALETVTKKPVKKFMHAWTSLSGFPIVRVNKVKNILSLSQERFFLLPPKTKDTTIWPVPLLSSDPVPDLLEIASASVDLKKSDFMKLNVGQTGFYRVIYDDTQSEKLAAAITKKELPPLDRLGILSDNLEAAKSGYSSTVTVLKLAANLSDEDNTAVWEVLAEIVGSVRRAMNDDDIRNDIKPYIQKLTAKQLKRLGWTEKPSDSHFDRLLRPIVLGLSAIADEPSVIKKVKRQFNSMTKSEDIPPDVRGIVYSTMARLGGEAEFKKLLKLYEQTNSSEEKTTLTAALTNFRQPKLIEKTISLIDSDKVRLQDTAYWIAYSFNNRFAKDRTWDWLTSHWQWLDKNLGKDLSFYRLPLYAARAYSDDSFLPKFTKFFDKVKTPALDRSIKQGVETIKWQSNWRKRDLQSIKDYLKKL